MLHNVRAKGLRGAWLPKSQHWSETFFPLENKAHRLTGVTPSSQQEKEDCIWSSRVLRYNLNPITQGSLAFQRHTDTPLAISDSGPEDERSKVTSALLLMSMASLSHSTTSTDPGRSCSRWTAQSLFPGGCRGISVSSGCDSLPRIHHTKEGKGVNCRRWRWESSGTSAQSSKARGELMDCQVSPELKIQTRRGRNITGAAEA